MDAFQLAQAHLIEEPRRFGRKAGANSVTGSAAAFTRASAFGFVKVRVGIGVRFRAMMQADKVTVDATLDATGLLCPLPVLKARRALKPLAPGGVLEVLATDPGATKDFEHFCATTGCELLEASEQPGGVLRFRMRKPG
jgi:tRNA 2-thiouridine synthesizing protein A